MGEVTMLLEAARAGNPQAVSQLFELVYDDLRHIARAKLRHRPDGMILQTTGLVHEAYLRLVSLKRLELHDKLHFLTYAARVMRSVVVDLVRQQRAERHGGGITFVSLDTEPGTPTGGDEVLRVHEALLELAAVEERLVRVVEMRYFVGMGYAEIAEALDVGVRTVERDWEKARSFLFAALKTP